MGNGNEWPSLKNFIVFISKYSLFLNISFEDFFSIETEWDAALFSRI